MELTIADQISHFAAHMARLNASVVRIMVGDFSGARTELRAADMHLAVLKADTRREPA